MATLSAIHGVLSNTAWLFFLIIGLWGLLRAIRGQPVNGNYLGAAFIGQLIFVAQAILGAILWIGGGDAAMQRPGIHLLLPAVDELHRARVLDSADGARTGSSGQVSHAAW